MAGEQELIVWGFGNLSEVEVLPDCATERFERRQAGRRKALREEMKRERAKVDKDAPGGWGCWPGSSGGASASARIACNASCDRFGK